MNRAQGQVDVVTEVGYCPSCGRTRNLRSEKHHLGGLVRTIVTCETCHRTLSSSIGVATPEPAVVEAQPEPQAEPAPAPVPKVPAKKAVAKKPAAKPAAKKPAVKTPAVKKPAARKPTASRGGKPTSTTARKATRRK